MAKSRAHRIIPTPLDGESVPFGALEITMPPPSLNNLFVNGKKGRFKSAEYKTWQVKAVLQLRRQGSWHVPGSVAIKLAFGRSQTRADLDNLIKPTLDLLMAAGRISDDRNVHRVEAEFVTGTLGTRIEIRKADAKAIMRSQGEGECLRTCGAPERTLADRSAQ